MAYDVAIETSTNVQKDLNKGASTVAGLLNLENAEDKRRFTQSMKHYEVDLDIYDDIFSISNPMQKNVTEGQEELPVFDKLDKDIFLSLYKYRPEIRRESKMKASTKINNQIMRELVEEENFKSLRRNCCLDLFNSAMATELIGKKAIEIIRRYKEEEEKRKEEAKERGENPGKGMFELIQEALDNENAMDEAQQTIDDILGRDPQGENEDSHNQGDDGIIDDIDPNSPEGQELSNAAMSLEAAKKLAEQIAQQLEDTIDEKEIKDLAHEISNAMNNMTNQIAKDNELLRNWGFNPEENNEGQRISIDQKREALERIRNSNKLQKMAKLIGNFKETAIQDQKKKSRDGAVTIKSIETGNKIQNVLPSEKMHLLNDTTKLNFYKKYNQKELLQYEVESNTVKAKGPMVVLIDTSGSMQGEQELWSKAVAIALLEVANLQKRNFAAIHFSSTARKPIIIEKGSLDPNKVLDIAEYFDNGGTDFMQPLNKAIEVLKNSKFKKGDIVMITDGEAYVDDGFLKEFKKTQEDKEFKVLSVCINIGNRYVNTDTLKRFSDDVVLVSDFAELTNADSDIAHTIFNNV